MAGLKVQTGRGDELSAEACACLQHIKEAETLLAGLSPDPALTADSNFRAKYQSLCEGVKASEIKMKKISMFIETSMEQYERMEMQLTMEAQNLGIGTLLTGTPQMEHLKNLFEDNAGVTAALNKTVRSE